MRNLLFVATIVLVPILGLAQIPEPPEELSKLAPMMGNWEASGTGRETPDGPEGDWTAVLTVKKILDGYAIQEDAKVDLGAGIPVPLVLRTIYWWDAHTKRIQYFTMGNVGFGGIGSLFETQDGKLVSSSTRLMTMTGVPVTEQVVTDLSRDGVLKMEVRRSLAGGEFFTGVEGTYKRGGKGFPDSDKTGNLGLLPPPTEMAEVSKDAGTWTVKGGTSPMPGVPLIPVSGQQKLQPILGGHAYLGTVQGNPVPGSPKAYRGHSYLTWDPASACMLSLDLDNFGVQSLGYGHLTQDKKRIYLSLGTPYGIPQVYRTLLEPTDGADKQKITIHRLAADAAPDISFEAEIERVKEAKNSKTE